MSSVAAESLVYSSMQAKGTFYQLLRIIIKFSVQPLHIYYLFSSLVGFLVSTQLTVTAKHLQQILIYSKLDIEIF